MTGKLKKSPPTRRDAEDGVRLKMAGVPAHINPREDDYLKRVLPEAAGKVVKTGLLAEAGTDGDDRVTLLTAQERARLKRRGGSGDRNPNTGLLQYGDGMGGSDNPGGGHDASASGAPGGGGGYGPGPSSGPSGGGYYGGDVNTKPDIANMSLSDLQDQYSQHSGSFINSLLSMPNNYRAPGYEDLPGAFQFSPPDTFGRLRDTYLHGPPPSYTERGKVPGNLGMPNALGPGIVGKAATTFAGPVMSAMMNVGRHMDQAMSPETRAASLSANQAQGARNSTGRDAISPAALEALSPGTQFAGTSSGSATAQMPQIPPGYTRNAAGQLIPLQGKNRSALRDPARNLLIDYVLNGRQGGRMLG